MLSAIKQTAFWDRLSATVIDKISLFVHVIYSSPGLYHWQCRPAGKYMTQPTSVIRIQERRDLDSVMSVKMGNTFVLVLLWWHTFWWWYTNFSLTLSNGDRRDHTVPSMFHILPQMCHHCVLHTYIQSTSKWSKHSRTTLSKFAYMSMSFFL